MLFRFLILFSIIFASCNSKQVSEKVRAYDSEQKEINALANRYHELGRFSGSILIKHQNKFRFEKSYGYANHSKSQAFTKDTSFKIGELSSLFLNKVLLDQVLEKGLDMHSPVSGFINEVTVNMTLNELLNDDNNNEYTKSLKEKLLAALNEKSIDLLLDELSENLKLTNTYFTTSEKPKSIGHLYINNGNGLEWTESPEYNEDSKSFSKGIKSTPTDLLHLLENISAKTINLDGYLEDDGYSYAVVKTLDTSIIILSNTRHPVPKEMSKSILAILSNQSYVLPLPRKEVAIDLENLKRFAGSYQMGPQFELMIDEEAGVLYTKMGSSKTPLIPQSENQFFMDAADAAIRFVEDDNNNITGAIMLDGFLNGTFIEKLNK